MREKLAFCSFNSSAASGGVDTKPILQQDKLSRSPDERTNASTRYFTYLMMGRADIDFLSPTLEALVLSSISGVAGQTIAAYSRKALFSIDFVQILRLLIYTAITTPPNHAFQLFLEEICPSHSEQVGADERKGRKIDIRNVIAKFILDQSIAATVNTAMWICLMGAIRGQSYADIRHELRNDFWPLLFAGYRFWPFVCFLNFAVVPFKLRPLVGNAAGLVWGAYLTLR